MTDISAEQVNHIAKLSRIALDADEVPRYAKHLTSILHYVEQLGAIPTDNVVPLRQVSGLQNVLREDVVTNSDQRTDLLANVPMRHNGFIQVKTVK